MIDFMYSSALTKRYESMIERQFNELTNKMGTLYMSQYDSYEKLVKQTEEQFQRAKTLRDWARKRLRAHACSSTTPFLFWSDEEEKNSLTLEAEQEGERGELVWHLILINEIGSIRLQSRNYEIMLHHFKEYLPKRKEIPVDDEIKALDGKPSHELNINQRIKLMEHQVASKNADMDYDALIEGDEYDGEADSHELYQLQLQLDSLKSVRYAMKRAEEDGGSAEDYLDMTPDPDGLE